MKGRLTRAQTTRSDTISCKGQLETVCRHVCGHSIQYYLSFIPSLGGNDPVREAPSRGLARGLALASQHRRAQALRARARLVKTDDGTMAGAHKAHQVRMRVDLSLSLSLSLSVGLLYIYIYI